MKRAALCLLSLLVLLPTAAFADSLDSISPSAFNQNDVEQFATLQGTGLQGTVSTQIALSGPFGSLTLPSSGGSGDGTVLFLNVPDIALSVPGSVSVTVQAIDGTTTRTIGPVFFTVIAQAQQPPLLSMPENIVAEATGPSGAIVTFTVGGFSFVDPGPPTVVCDHQSGDLFPVGATTVSCTATDSFTSTSGTFEVDVTDSVSPVLQLPANIITGNPVVTFTVTATDNVDSNPLVSCIPASGSTFSVGTTTVQCTATDSHANRSTGSFRVTVTGGATAPVLTMPNDLVAEASGPGGAVVSYLVTATGGATISCSPVSGSTFALGLTTVSCSATSAGGTSSDHFNVTVVDTTGPFLSVSPTINASATGPDGAVVTFTATATDLVDGPVAVGCFPLSGNTFPIGTTTVFCNASDARLNFTVASFDIIVSADSTPPVLTLPANITAEATSAAGAAVTYVATANDNVDGPVPVTCAPASGSTFAIGTTTVQCTASDAHNNTAHGSFTVLVRDTTPPTLTLPATITKEATSAAGATATFTVSATDIVDGSVPATCDHASGATYAIGTTTVVCTATDAHHNVGTGSFLIIVRDTTPPVLTLPANITAEGTSPAGAAVTFTATSTDIVAGARPVLCTPSSGSTFPLGTTTVQCTATDTHNNTAHGSFTVLVRDTTPPHIVRIDATPAVLWPPNHQMVNVSLSVIAVDAVDPAPMSHIVSVTSSQPVTGFGDETSPDWVITGPLTLQLRAERLEPLQCLIAIILPGVLCDRIYTITVATTDAHGNTTNGTVTVVVANPRGRAVL